MRQHLACHQAQWRYGSEDDLHHPVLLLVGDALQEQPSAKQNRDGHYHREGVGYKLEGIFLCAIIFALQYGPVRLNGARHDGRCVQKPPLGFEREPAGYERCAQKLSDDCLVGAVVKYSLRSLVQPLNSADAYIVLRQDKERFYLPIGQGIQSRPAVWVDLNPEAACIITGERPGEVHRAQSGDRLGLRVVFIVQEDASHQRRDHQQN